MSEFTYPFPDECDHNYEEVSSYSDMDGETYQCTKCDDRYRLYYEDMA